MADETLDLRDLLAKPLADFPDRPNLPGSKTFHGKLIAITAGTSKEKKTPFFHFAARITDPGKDVTSADLAPIAAAGFSLADYEVGADFYLTPNSMVMLRRFLVSLGISENVTFVEALHLNRETGEPTERSQEVVRGLDVLIRTPAKDDQGRVFLNNVNDSRSGGMMIGTKRAAA